MCNELMLSTTSEEDLTAHNNELVQFSAELRAIADVSSLKYPRKWYIGSRSGCSCSFRHWLRDNGEPEFGEPEDWREENPADIAATLQVIAIIRGLVVQQESVDCLDVWNPQEALPTVTNQREVALGAVSDREFRFFENYHFTFV
jgi:hypothetical protein